MSPENTNSPFTPIIPLETAADTPESARTPRYDEVVALIEEGIRTSAADGQSSITVDFDGETKFLGRFLAGDLYDKFNLREDEIGEIMDRFVNVKITGGEVTYGQNPNARLGHVAVGGTRERDFRERAANDDTLQ